MLGFVGILFLFYNLINDFCKLIWFFLEDDGGFLIINYVIEKREVDRKVWILVICIVIR